jgi:hypothetical protein
MSKHNYNHFAAQDYGQADGRFDSNHGRFMSQNRHERRHEKAEQRDRMEQRALQKKMQRDARRLGD